MREVEIDEGNAEGIFELEEVDEVEPLQVALVDALSVQVTLSVYSAADVIDEFDNINDERDKFILK